jgi:hypothetical protein
MSERLTEERCRQMDAYRQRLIRVGEASDPYVDDVGNLLADRAAQQAEITRLVARVGELEAALRPFAKAVETINQRSTSSNLWEIRGDLVGACRAAAQALANGEQAR